MRLTNVWSFKQMLERNGLFCCCSADCPYLCHPDFSFANGYCCPLCRDHKGSYDQLQGHSAPLDEPPGTGQGNMRQRLLCHQRPAPRDLYGTTGGQVRTARLRKENFFASRLAALHSRYSTPAMSKCGFFLMTLLIALYKSLIAFTWLWCLLNFLAPDTFQLFNQAENVRRALVQGLDIIELCPSIEESFFLDALGVKLVQFQQVLLDPRFFACTVLWPMWLVFLPADQNPGSSPLKLRKL